MTVQDLINALKAAQAKGVIIVEITINGHKVDWVVNDLLTSNSLLNSLIRQASGGTITVVNTKNI